MTGSNACVTRQEAVCSFTQIRGLYFRHSFMLCNFKDQERFFPILSSTNKHLIIHTFITRIMIINHANYEIF